MFKVLKDAGYHVCSIAPRGDLFSPGVTEMSVTEVSKDVALVAVLQEVRSPMTRQLHGWNRCHGLTHSARVDRIPAELASEVQPARRSWSWRRTPLQPEYQPASLLPRCPHRGGVGGL